MDYKEYLPKDLINLIDEYNDPYIHIKDEVIEDINQLHLVSWLYEEYACIKPSEALRFLYCIKHPLKLIRSDDHYIYNLCNPDC